MAITQCSECGGKVSTRAAACPHCGCPVEPPTPKITCPDCGEDFAASLTACPACGGPVEAPEDPQDLSEPTAPVAPALATAELDKIRIEQPVPVIESVGIPQTDLWTLYTSLEGRISRKTYWLRIVVPFAVAGLLGVFVDLVSGNWDAVSGVGPLSSIVWLVGFWPHTAGAVKRLHDRDMTGWHVGGLWGAGAFFIVLVLLGVGVENDSLLVVLGILSIPLIVFGIYLGVVVGFLRGTEGTNSYGPDPLGSVPQSGRDRGVARSPETVAMPTAAEAAAEAEAWARLRPVEGYFDNGQVQVSGGQKEGKWHGPYERYDENGQLLEKGTSNMGEPCGEWIYGGQAVTYPPCPPGLEDGN